ncbi:MULTISPECIES: hypothetical protein [unclassified Bradyrhizobium]|uniref:hypothetical protein n=1 Tax=unclassified Bradyrhizobium TaxID=2631580 RepID=UPI002FE63BAE
MLVRIDRDLEARIKQACNGKSMSKTAERLLRSALNDIENGDDAANNALGFIVAQAANAAGWNDRTWRNDASTTRALKLAIPAIIDLLAPTPEESSGEEHHPLFRSADEHARQIFFWIVNRLKERGDEYGSDWPAGHPLRNFPRAADALNFTDLVATATRKVVP